MFEVNFKDTLSRARCGRLDLGNGRVAETPAYVIVATNAAVRALEPEDLPLTRTQMLIVNTYHMWRELGEEGLHDFPGLHEFMRWPGIIMTDSGGFQVFSLGFLRDSGWRRLNIWRSDDKISDGKISWVRVTEAGVYFRPNGLTSEEELYLDAETSIKIQEQLGSDIIVAFDEPTPPAGDYVSTRAAMERTHRWAERCLAAKKSGQKIYGVVQGGAYPDLRAFSADFIASLPFDGFAIGSTYGDAYGGTKEKTRLMLEWSVPRLPAEKPRHLFGVGRIEDVLDGVAAGIDTFDCVIPTREARHGGVWTTNGRLDIKKGKYAGDGFPLDPECWCLVCAGEASPARDLLDRGAKTAGWDFSRPVSRGEIHEFFRKRDPRGGRLATIHNIYFFNALMENIREAIRAGRFSEFKLQCLARLKSNAE